MKGQSRARTFVPSDWLNIGGSVVLIAAYIAWEGKSGWSAAAALLALYAIIATAFWREEHRQAHLPRAFEEQ